MPSFILVIHPLSKNHQETFYTMIRDLDLFKLIEHEQQRQKRGIELIASENFVSIV